MIFKKNSLMEGPDGKLSARQRAVVKRVLDTTNGDLDAAVAVAQTELQKEDLDSNDATSLQEEVARYTIGGKPYTNIEQDLEEVIDYIDISQSDIDYARDGEPLTTFSDICEAVSECLDYSPEEASDAAYAIKQYLEDRGWVIEDSPEEGSRADRRSGWGRSRKKKSLLDLTYESLEEEIIEPRQRKTSVSKVHSFTWKDDPEAGFSFPVDEDEEVDIDNEDAKRNYQYCLDHPDELIDDGIIENKNTYTEPALMKCDKCGEEFYLQDDYMGACECPNCGQWYNLFGQMLKDPELWDKGDDYYESLCEDDSELDYRNSIELANSSENILSDLGAQNFSVDDTNICYVEFDENSFNADKVSSKLEDAGVADYGYFDLFDKIVVWYSFDKVNEQDLPSESKSMKESLTEAVFPGQEMWNSLSGSDQFVVEYSLEEIEKKHISDPEEVEEIVLHYCNEVGFANEEGEIDEEPDFDRCLDFVKASLGMDL